jgi:hypothetical protein
MTVKPKRKIRRKPRDLWVLYHGRQYMSAHTSRLDAKRTSCSACGHIVHFVEVVGKK